MGSVVFGSITLQGQKFDDIKLQKSKAGEPRPIIFGTVRPIVGNVIATTPPLIRKYTEKVSGGILEPEVEMEVEHVYRTYAIRICEGPVTAISRAWRNGELVFVNDPEQYVTEFYPESSNSDKFKFFEVIFGNKIAFQEKFEFFLGGFDQMPSSVMQGAFGLQNVHAYRGTCYMVAENDLLDATSGAIPQWTFEVSRCPDTPMMY